MRRQREDRAGDHRQRRAPKEELVPHLRAELHVRRISGVRVRVRRTVRVDRRLGGVSRIVVSYKFHRGAEYMYLSESSRWYEVDERRYKVAMRPSPTASLSARQVWSTA